MREKFKASPHLLSQPRSQNAAKLGSRLPASRKCISPEIEKQEIARASVSQPGLSPGLSSSIDEGKSS